MSTVDCKNILNIRALRHPSITFNDTITASQLLVHDGVDRCLAILCPFAVFWTYRDDERVKKRKSVCNGTLFTVENIPATSEDRIRDRQISRPALLTDAWTIKGSKQD